MTFAYDIATLTKSDIPIGQYGGIDWTFISFTGKYVVLCSSGDNLYVFKNSTTGTMVNSPVNAYGLPSHQDFTIDENGDDVIVGNCKAAIRKSRHNPMVLHHHAPSAG